MPKEKPYIEKVNECNNEVQEVLKKYGMELKIQQTIVYVPRKK